MRFLTPILFAAAAVGVGMYNAQHTDRALVLPFLDVLDPAGANDPARMGMLTVQVLGGIAVIFGIWDGVSWLRSRRSE